MRFMRVRESFVSLEGPHCAFKNQDIDVIGARQEFIRTWPWYIQT